MEDNKYLTLARQARKERNSEDAKNYYSKVREEDPESGEAKFFYSFYSMYEGTNGELPRRFATVCRTLSTSIKMIQNSDVPSNEKFEIISAIIDTFIPEPWSTVRYMNHKNTETRIGDSYVQVFSRTDVANTCKRGMFTIRDIGDELAKFYSDDPRGMNLAVKAWKEYVSLAQKWYAYPPKGEAGIYAEKIKKYEPSYEMPKKAGCISLSNHKK